VVLLAAAAGRHPKIRAANPDRGPGETVRVRGMTGLDPEERFKNHKRGYKAAGWWRKWGVQLMPELYETFESDAF